MSHQMRNLSKPLPSPYSKDMKEENEQQEGHNSVDTKQQYSYQNTNNENFTYDSASDSETAARNYNNQYNKPSSIFFHSSNSHNMNRYSKLASHAHNSYVSGNLTDGDEDNDQAGDYSNSNINNRHRHNYHGGNAGNGGGVEDDDGDEDIRDNESVDEFNLNALKHHPFHTPSSLNHPSSQLSLNKVVKTGRQRKKEAARSKGGEFQAKRKKKRIYFCCVSSEIDVEKLYDYFITSGGLTKDKEWSLKMYSDVLHLHKPGNSQNSAANEMLSPRNSARLPSSATVDTLTVVDNSTASTVNTPVNNVQEKNVAPFSPIAATTAAGLTAVTVAKANEEDTHTRISTYGSQEVFIFDFGAIVFWGFSRGDEEPFLKSIRMFVTKGYVQPHEFPSGEDDMAFVCTGSSNNSGGGSSGGSGGGSTVNHSHNNHTSIGGDRSMMTMLGSIDEGGGNGGDGISNRAAMSSSNDGHNNHVAIVPPLLHPASDILFQPLITIANDVLTIPEDTPAKQRLSLSFAIAQSAVLSIFESRIDRKIVEYKYIPETMAKHGRIHLNERQLGTMIGEVFVIRHDVNLHTEILDTPDFFWKDGEKYEKDYKLIMRYLEMGARTEVLNKRLDMMRELLDVLQQQMENDHGVKLEWIVIWLIVVEVVLQMIAIAVDSLAWKSTHSIV